MKSVGRRLFLISFILAVVASGAVYMYLQSLDEEEVVIEKEKIIVASTEIPARTKIEENMIKEIEISKDSVYGNFINNKSEIIGKYSKVLILPDDRFHDEKLINEVKEELSLKIKGNHRAISIIVSGESGVSDLIQPGDFVDVFVTLPQIKESNRIVRSDLTKMLLQNIEVLAIDKKIFRDSEKREEIPSSYFITVSVPIFNIEKLVLAEDVGRLKLALRPLDGDLLHQSDGTIWQELLLDDFYEMIDMFPQYDVKSIVEKKIDNEEYKYEKYYYYTVQYGDTLRKISKNFYDDESKYELIKQVNRIEDENEIIAGTGIKIPILNTDE